MSVNQMCRCSMERKMVLIFCFEGETLCHQFSLIARISKQCLLSTYHNNVGVWTKSSECSMELPVEHCAAPLQIHICAHVSAFLCFGETTRQVVVTLQYTVGENKIKVTTQSRLPESWRRKPLLTRICLTANRVFKSPQYCT